MTSKNEAKKTPTLDDSIEPTPLSADAETMKAIIQTEYGSAPERVLRLAEIDRPAIVDDEVLVRVRAASVDRGTWHLMTGLPKLMRIMGFGFRRPKAPNPGRSLAGIVEAVGQNVTEFKPGDEVYGTCDGSFTEFALARAGLLAGKPANLSFEQAATVPVSGVTALQHVRDRAQVKPGQKVLIIGASGGVGTFAVPDRQGLRCRGHRRLQHGQNGSRPGPRCRSRRRLHPRRLRRRRAALRRHPRHWRQQPIVPPPSGPHPWWKARHRRRRDRWAAARRLRPPAPGNHSVPAGEPEAGHPRRQRERRGLIGAPGTPRIGEGHASHRPVLPDWRGRSRNPLLPGGSRPRQGRHHRVRRKP